MRVLDQTIDLAHFFAELAASERCALFLDYDGTIAPFTPDPSKAYAYPGILALLQRLLNAGDTRIVFISGRRLVDLVPLLPLVPMPELWGSHGYERLRPGCPPELFPVSTASRQALESLRNQLDGRWVGVHLEVKPASIAVHWRGRQAAQAAAIRSELAALWAATGERGAVVAEEFDGGMEFKARDRDKGSAVRDALMAGEVTAYLGDDLTDEDAFQAIAGRGLGVLVRPELRATRASVWLQTPGEVEAFLEDWEVIRKDRRCGGIPPKKRNRPRT